MNILIASGIFPPDIGGPATFAPLAAEALAARGHRVTVLTMSDGRGQRDAGAYLVIRVVRDGAAPRRWMAAAAALLDASVGADVIFALGLLPEAVAVTMLRRRPLVARIVSDVAWDRAMAYGWTTDDLQTFNSRRYGPAIELLKWVHAGAMRRANLVVVPSRWLAAWVGRRGVPAAHIRIVPNALAPVPVISPRRLPAPTPHLVAAVGRLVAFKQFDLTIRAVAGLPDVTLVVIGDGPKRRALQALAGTLGVADRVIFAGILARDQMFALLAGCDAMVQSSSYEGLPHVVFEAMAVGIPVVATAVGGTTEIVVDGETGLLTDGTVPAIRAALSRLLASPRLRGDLAARARETARTRYSVEAMAEATERVLMEASAS